jgi:sterol desaturase/sphingolipid hydroxylase (fatty acid hydroxylase superfamily)
MPLEIICGSIIVVWAALLIILERCFPYQKGYELFRPEFWSDLILYTFIQSYILGIAIAWIIRSIDAITGVSRTGLVSGWSFGFQLLFFFVLHDFWQYWFHRLEHRNKIFWRIHEAGHAPVHVDWLAGSRSHALEILIAQTFEFAPIFLLGGSAEIAIVKGMIDSVWGMFNHSNINIRMGPVLYLLNGPELHRFHHDLDAPKGGANLSTKIALWDHLFGTAYYPKEHLPRYGLDDEIHFPYGNYLKQFVYVFRRE